ncbi:unnamed protein product, partial [Notodromas monacha]
DYEVDAYLRQEWTDARLNHTEIKEPMDLSDPALVKAIWKPEVYFPNAKQADFQYVTVPNVLIRINPSGRILYMLRAERASTRHKGPASESREPLEMTNLSREFSDNNGFLAMGMNLQNVPSRAFQPQTKLSMRAHQIDESCRLIFPLLFTIFNFSYWIYYLFVV